MPRLAARSVGKKGGARQREKTPGQIVNEFEEILAVEREKAAKRRQATQNNDTAGEIAESETFPEQRGEARDKAAEKVNEFEEMLAVERERAKQRQGERADLEEHSGKVSTKSSGERARKKAAEKVSP